MARLTTHVVDTARGMPAAGVAVALVQLAGEAVIPIANATTNAAGRTDAPLADGDLRTGTYELRFALRAYFGGEGLWDEVPVRFDVRDASGSYHIPLLVSPWSYSTYRDASS